MPGVMAEDMFPGLASPLDIPTGRKRHSRVTILELDELLVAVRGGKSGSQS
jgi:hypothetical protein